MIKKKGYLVNGIQVQVIIFNQIIERIISV